MKLSFKAPCAELVSLDCVWLQLSNISCNLRCRHCFLDCHHDSRKRNFLEVERILNSLKNIKSLKMIYLTGGEPFLHPRINDILKYCLKKSEVTICSNGTLLNEKKFKVIKHIESEASNKLYLRLSLDHFTEGRNDEYRGTGVFKKVMKALLLAQKYDIKTYITCVNLKNESEEILKEGFVSLFEKNEIAMSYSDIKIVPMLKIGNYAKYYNISQEEKNVSYEDMEKFDINNLDCKSSRVITQNGVYSCPALINDPRGRLGENISDADKDVYLETQTCYDCVKRAEKLFG